MTVVEPKPFNVVVSLVKTQIRAEKRLHKNGFDRCSGALGILMDKYDWISSPGFSPAEERVSQQPPPGTPGKPLSRGGARVPEAQTAAPPRLPKAAPVLAPTPRGLPDGWTEADEDHGLIDCPYCARKFAADRIDKHKSVCPQHPTKKSKAAKRGAMNMSTRRIQAVAEGGAGN